MTRPSSTPCASASSSSNTAKLSEISHAGCTARPTDLADTDPAAPAYPGLQGNSQHAFSVRPLRNLDRAAPESHHDDGAHRGRGHQLVPARYRPAVRQAGGPDANLLAGQGRAVDLPVHQDEPGTGVPAERARHRCRAAATAAAAAVDASGPGRVLRI